MELAHSYERISSLEQRKGQGLKRQREKIEAYCQTKGLALIDSYTDSGLSGYHGTNSTRGALSRFIEAVRSGTLSTPCHLVVESLDRLSREEVKKAQRQFYDLLDLGVTIHTIIDGKVYDNNTDFGDLIYSIVSMQRAYDESLTKSSRAKAIWESKRKGNGARAGRLPFWLYSDEGTIQANPEKVEVLRLIFKLYLEGCGTKLIAKELNNRGLKTSLGKVWHNQAVHKILTNKATIGHWESNGQVSTGYYPKIIPSNDYYQVQELLRARRKNKEAGRVTEVRNLFSGVIYCGNCDSKMHYRPYTDYPYLRLCCAFVLLVYPVISFTKYMAWRF